MPERGEKDVSWLTTCPRCHTTFRVGQEQLDAYGGSVRCGKCQHVFNARQALKPEVEPAPEPAPAPEIVEPAPEPVVEEPVPPQAIPSPVEEVAAVEEEPPVEIPAEEIIEEIVLTALPEEPPPVAEPIPEPAPLETEEQASVPAAEAVLLEKPRRSLTWLWIVASLFLLLAMTVQVLYTFRVELAARSPAMKPLLVQLCGALQCRVSLPRHVETLGIEGSDLQADPQRPGVLILSAVLRSRADYAQQYPLLELTLTDTADKPVVRRVFQPAEYLPKGREVDAGMPAQGEVAIKLNLQLKDLQPVGYRLYLFYAQDAAGNS